MIWCWATHQDCYDVIILCCNLTQQQKPSSCPFFHDRPTMNTSNFESIASALSRWDNFHWCFWPKMSNDYLLKVSWNCLLHKCLSKWRLLCRFRKSRCNDHYSRNTGQANMIILWRQCEHTIAYSSIWSDLSKFSLNQSCTRLTLQCILHFVMSSRSQT